MKVDPIFGMFEFNLFGQTAYVYALVVLFIWFLIAWRLVHSPFGRSLDGIRQNPRRMRAIGTPVWWRLLADLHASRPRWRAPRARCSRTRRASSVCRR